MTPTPVPWEGPPLEAWDAWRPEAAAERLEGVAAPWCVVGGWALDLWLGRESRAHGDLEIAVPRPFIGEMPARLHGFDLYAVSDGGVQALSPEDEPPADKYQIWVSDGAAWRLDIMAEPGDADTWVYRRNEAIMAPRSEMVGVSASGLPYLKPHGVLFYKAAKPRPKDEADFSVFAPLLDPPGKAWLREMIAQLFPDHAWLARLTP